MSAARDRFAEEHLPSPQEMPCFRFDLPELRYPARMNAVTAFVDRHVDEGRGSRRAIAAPGGTNWSYDDLHRIVNAIANVLVRELGVVPGTRVLLRAPNSPMLAACWLAVIKAGAIAVNTMPLYRASELRYIIEKARAGLALCDVRLRGELDEALRERTDIRVVDFASDAADSLESMIDRADGSFGAIACAAEDVALIAFTSGTTGFPKATMHYHRDLLAICDTYAKHVLQPRASDLFTGSPPLAFTFGLGGLLLFPLYAGAATVLIEKTQPEELLRTIDAYGVTTVFTAPLAYRAMSTMLERYDVHSLHTCVSAGETLPKPVFDEWLARTNLRIQDGIGSTEMLHVFIGSPRGETRSGSTGRVVPGYVAQIHDDEGNALPPGAVGRLAVQGPTGCKYLEDERQGDYVQRGWNYPGDAYRVDDEGYFYYVARTDDLIVSAGYNISGPEVEQALLGHEHVREAAVVGKPDPAHGTNIVKAYVVMTAGEHCTAEKIEELREHVKAVIAPYKAPREIEFVAELPRTLTGKVQRFRLRERAQGESVT
ncbi:MAG TPA: AMP-binding protein [Candidatus Acidoferrales bacterium]|nr:AMP-binding protein [Candidatus Acidoferrales bacterium]